ncbi:MAG: chromate transporter, partial [Fusobacteriaceae bacterium]
MENKDNLILKIFIVFFKIGAFTIGGGYAMLSLIEDEIVNKKKWLSQDEFLEGMVIAQSTPGVLAVNISIVTGYKIAG